MFQMLRAPCQRRFQNLPISWTEGTEGVLGGQRTWQEWHPFTQKHSPGSHGDTLPGLPPRCCLCSHRSPLLSRAAPRTRPPIRTPLQVSAPQQPPILISNTNARTALGGRRGPAQPSAPPGWNHSTGPAPRGWEGSAGMVSEKAHPVWAGHSGPHAPGLGSPSPSVTSMLQLTGWASQGPRASTPPSSGAETGVGRAL